jgi:hypothetical protein
MVKNIVPVVRHADYEAQHRTLAVSEKSRIGMPLIEIIDEHRQVAGQSRFQSERFVHAQIREYILRSAAHSKHQEGRPFSDESISGASHFDVAQKLCKSDLSVASLGFMPQQLRAFVVAQILKDAKFDVKTFSDNQRFCKSLSMRDTATLLMSYLIVSGSIKLTKNQASERKMTSSIRIAEKITSNKVSCSGHISYKKESGFGTAPIWYQQSMQNGPPSRHSRWKGKKNMMKTTAWQKILMLQIQKSTFWDLYLKVASWTL